MITRPNPNYKPLPFETQTIRGPTYDAHDIFGVYLAECRHLNIRAHDDLQWRYHNIVGPDNGISRYPTTRSWYRELINGWLDPATIDVNSNHHIYPVAYCMEQQFTSKDHYLDTVRQLNNTLRIEAKGIVALYRKYKLESNIVCGKKRV